MMTVDARTLAVYRKVSKKSDYVGTVSELKQTATVNAVVKPVTDSVSVELYGAVRRENTRYADDSNNG